MKIWRVVSVPPVLVCTVRTSHMAMLVEIIMYARLQALMMAPLNIMLDSFLCG